MRYSEEIIRKVAEANDLVDLIRQYVTLKKVGNRYVGSCPFHNERTPSFTVSPEKQMYHCFGCGVGGNVYTFVKEQENLSFPEAIEFLADRAGIELPQTVDPEAEAGYQKRKVLTEVHRQAANFYYKRLAKNQRAQRYLKERGLNIETIKHFGIGVASEQWEDLRHHLNVLGFDDELLLESGLVLSGKNGGCYDRFRNRIMIPILSVQDKVIAFGGRQYQENQNGPKYLNSPETPVFSKSYELFNLNEAKKHIIDDHFIIVEGYMDVIALWQYGIKNTVAALGTAFTPFHAKTLARYVKEVILCFDGDEAGKNATVKAIGILRKSPLNIRIIRLGAKDDPDSYIREHGLSAYNECIRSAMTITEFELSLLKEQFDLNTSDGRVKYLNGAVDLLKNETNTVTLELYVQQAAKEGDISAQILMKEIQKRQQGRPSEIQTIQPKAGFGSKIPKAYLDAQKAVLQTMIISPEVIRNQLSDEDFSGGSLRRLFQAISQEAELGHLPLTLSSLALNLTELKDQQALSAIMMTDETTESLDECIACIKTYSQKKREKKVLRQIREADTDEGEKLEALNRLLKERCQSEEEGD